MWLILLDIVLFLIVNAVSEKEKGFSKKYTFVKIIYIVITIISFIGLLQIPYIQDILDESSYKFLEIYMLYKCADLE